MATITTQDMWPTDFGEPRSDTPAAILREQAALLGRKTKNLVEADVRTYTKVEWDGEWYDFSHQFELVVPTLGNYRYCLLTVLHKVDPYPALIESERLGNAMATTADEFVALLAERLSSDAARRVVANLLSQAAPRLPA